jgi:hypothetical protein
LGLVDFFGSPLRLGNYSTGPKKLSRFKEIQKEAVQVVCLPPSTLVSIARGPHKIMDEAQESRAAGGIGLFQVGISTVTACGRTTQAANRTSGTISIRISRSGLLWLLFCALSRKGRLPCKPIQIDQLLAQGLGAYVLSTLAPPPPQLVSITQRKIEITNPTINYFLILTLILADSNNSVTDTNTYAVDTGMSIDSMRYPGLQTPLP